MEYVLVVVVALTVVSAIYIFLFSDSGNVVEVIPEEKGISRELCEGICDAGDMDSLNTLLWKGFNISLDGCICISSVCTEDYYKIKFPSRSYNVSIEIGEGGYDKLTSTESTETTTNPLYSCANHTVSRGRIIDRIYDSDVFTSNVPLLDEDLLVDCAVVGYWAYLYDNYSCCTDFQEDPDFKGSRVMPFEMFEKDEVYYTAVKMQNSFTRSGKPTWTLSQILIRLCTGRDGVWSYRGTEETIYCELPQSPE